jgi:hypothetical protein
MTTAAALIAILSSLGLLVYARGLLSRVRAIIQQVEDYADKTGDLLDRIDAEAQGVLPPDGE